MVFLIGSAQTWDVLGVLPAGTCSWMSESPLHIAVKVPCVNGETWRCLTVEATRPFLIKTTGSVQRAGLIDENERSDCWFS